MVGIPYPTGRISEFEIQAMLYGRLKQEGFNVKGEVKAKKSRLDLVVYDVRNKPVCIIETKSWKWKTKSTETKQLTKYRELFDVPVLVCGRTFQVEKTVDKVINLFVNSDYHI